MPRPCIVGGCATKYLPPRGGMIHCFPNEPCFAAIWRLKTGCDLPEDKLKNVGVCSSHFSCDQYKISLGLDRRGQLFTSAVPTLNLPNINLQSNNCINKIDKTC